MPLVEWVVPVGGLWLADPAEDLEGVDSAGLAALGARGEVLEVEEAALEEAVVALEDGEAVLEETIRIA